MLIAALLLIGCTAGVPDQPSVLLITLDGVRADRLGSYGHRPTETPNLDALAKAGTQFNRAYTTSTSREPALVSVLTGTPPPVHGHRFGGANFESGLAPLGWVGALLGKGFEGVRIGRESDVLAPWFSKSEGDIGVASDGSNRLIWLPIYLSDGERDLPGRAYDRALHSLDERVGEALDVWKVGQPLGLVIVVGLRGSLSGARYGAALGLTDDLVRVPMIVSGPNVRVEWVVDDPVSTMDLGVWIAGRYDLPAPAHGVSPFQGGSDLPYSESTVGWSMFHAHPLQGFTDLDGRYTEATYGSWFPAVSEGVRVFPDPQSEYPELAARLSGLRSGFGRDEGLPLEARTSTIDPAGLVASLSLVEKARKAMVRGHIDGASRIAAQLVSEHGDAPAVAQIRREIQALQ
jgi:hypothetical protein